MSSQKPISIAVASDTKAFQRGIRDGVLEPLEDMQQALEDAGKQGDKAGEQLEDAMREAQRATDDLTDEQKKLQRTLEDGSRSSFRKLAANAEKGMDDAGEASKDLRDEIKSNVAEVSASFTGDLDSAIDGVQGTMAGLAMSPALGPYGLIAAGAGAAGGAFYSAFRSAAEATETRIADMYDDMIESQDTFLSESYKLEQYWKILKNEDGAVLSLKKANEYAEKTGLSVQQIALAWAGNDDQMKIVIDSLNTAISETKTKQAQAHGDAKKILADEITWLENIRDKTAARNDEIAATSDAVGKARAAWNVYGSDAARQLQAQHEQLGSVYDQLGTVKSAIDGLPQKKVIPVTLETDTNGVVKAIQKDLDKHTFDVYVKPKTRGGQRAI